MNPAAPPDDNAVPGRASAPRMPAEWEPHTRTWMAFPPPNATFGESGSPTLAAARTAWSATARAVARHEAVTVVARSQDEAFARDLLGPGIEVRTAALDDAWMRDIGPSFVLAGRGELQAVDWVFNGWGGQSAWARWDRDDLLASTVADWAGAGVLRSELVNEGGGLHVDGEGTVLLTDTVQLDPGRNPGWTRERVEAEVHARLGTSTAIWLSRGLTRDYDAFGTRGHVDVVAAFVRPGVVAVHDQRDPAHPDHEVSADLIDTLSSSLDARGRRLEVVRVPAPVTLKHDGEFVDWSYLNHYVCTGAVVLGTFADDHDAEAASILSDCYPGRTIETVDARDVFAFGGGVHCITQQQPAVR